MKSQIRKFKKNIMMTGAISIMVLIVPIIIYIFLFKNNGIAIDPAKWSEFGDFIGGVVGTSLGLIALIMSILSINYSLEIASKIHENETILVQAQNKPFGHIEILKYDYKTEINLINHGIGPLILDNVQITHEDNSKEYNNFNTLLRFEFGDMFDEDNTTIHFNSDLELVLGVNITQNLLKIFPTGDKDENFEDCLLRINKVLVPYKLMINYKDIFDNEYSTSKYLDFLKPNLLI